MSPFLFTSRFFDSGKLNRRKYRRLFTVRAYVNFHMMRLRMQGFICKTRLTWKWTFDVWQLTWSWPFTQHPRCLHDFIYDGIQARPKLNFVRCQRQRKMPKLPRSRRGLGNYEGVFGVETPFKIRPRVLHTPYKQSIRPPPAPLRSYRAEGRGRGGFTSPYLNRSFALNLLSSLISVKPKPKPQFK